MTSWNDPGHKGKLKFVEDYPPSTAYHDACFHPEYAEKITTIRRSDFNQVVAAIRIVAQETKRSRYRLDQLIAWVVEVLRNGVSVLLVDLFRSGLHDPHGIHKLVWEEFIDNGFVLPRELPLTLASYRAKPCLEAFVEPTAFGRELTAMPLFLDSGNYVEVPLEAAYRKAFDGEPRHLGDLLT